jgi:hypothetical protein
MSTRHWPAKVWWKRLSVHWRKIILTRSFSSDPVPSAVVKLMSNRLAGHNSCLIVFVNASSRYITYPCLFRSHTPKTFWRQTDAGLPHTVFLGRCSMTTAVSIQSGKTILGSNRDERRHLTSICSALSFTATSRTLSGPLSGLNTTFTNDRIRASGGRVRQTVLRDPA